jgi:hypothetical protein
MEFRRREEAQQFLNTYSFAAGFSIAVVSSIPNYKQEKK